MSSKVSRKTLIESWAKFATIVQNKNLQIHEFLNILNNAFIQHYTLGKTVAYDGNNIPDKYFKLNGESYRIDYFTCLKGDPEFVNHGSDTPQINFVFYKWINEKEQSRYKEMISFVHRFCNPDFVYILEKAILEIS